MLASLAFVLSGCSGVAFEPNRQAFQGAAARIAESGGEAPSHTIALSGNERPLAVDGVAHLYVRPEAKYIFFPQQVDAPNHYSGYLFISGDGQPGAMLESFTEIGAGWWKGELSQQVLAGG